MRRNPSTPNDPMTLLQINNLQTFFRTPQGVAKAVDGVSLEMEEGEVLGIVGDKVRLRQERAGLVHPPDCCAFLLRRRRFSAAA